VTGEGVIRVGEMPAKGQLSIGTRPYARPSGRADAKQARQREHGKDKPDPRLPSARKAAQGTSGIRGRATEAPGEKPGRRGNSPP
jgi:hypothetical protein